MRVNRKKAALIGLAATTLFGVAGCGRNEEPDVYGSPIPTTVTEQQNMETGVYGPPDDMGMGLSEERTEEATERETTGRIESTSEKATVDVQQNVPEPVYGPETEVYDYDKMSEEEIAELEARRDDVCEYLRAFINSEKFQAADIDTRVEMFYAELEDLSVNGTDKYPEPFVKADSWVYHEEEEEVEFEFIDGLPIFWEMSDKFKKSIQETTDVELP